jgi:hypothetical protein
VRAWRAAAGEMSDSALGSKLDALEEFKCVDFIDVYLDFEC